jgi:hypothetical protein
VFLPLRVIPVYSVSHVTQKKKGALFTLVDTTYYS